MSLERPLQSLSDDEVLAGLEELLHRSRRVEAPLISHIGEVDARHLYARFAAPSIFTYCTNILHMSEGEAQLRITVAKAAREHPILVEMLADGRLHLSGIAKLAPVLTAENRDALLARAVHKSKREIEEIVAELAPRPDAPSVMRKLPERPAPCPVLAPAPLEPLGVALPIRLDITPPLVARPAPVSRPVFEPLSPARYRVHFTAGPDLRDDLEALKALMRSEVPDGDLAIIVGKAVRQLRQRLEARRFAQAKSPRKRTPRTDDCSRYLPAETRRFVYRRDGGQCRFVDAQGRRCPERHRLEYHHRYPFGLGGGPDRDNICLMCGPHNRYLAELDYGTAKMSRYRRSTRRARESGSGEPRPLPLSLMGKDRGIATTNDGVTVLHIPGEVPPPDTADATRLDESSRGHQDRSRHDEA
jgi:hypothetical protein